jgi:hypothetical protein
MEMECKHAFDGNGSVFGVLGVRYGYGSRDLEYDWLVGGMCSNEMYCTNTMS